MAENQPTLFDVEIWKPVPGHEGEYEVSNHGVARSLGRYIHRKDGTSYFHPGRVLNRTPDEHGYPRVNMQKNGKTTLRLLHRVVLEAFVGPCPPGMEACHWDDDPSNARLSNLRWDTRRANLRDRERNGRKSWAKKVNCPYGHKLEAPNLVRAKAKLGRRNCLACSRARAYIQDNPALRPEIQKVSDSYYRALMADTAA